MTRTTDIDPMYASLERTARFVWTNLVSIVWISIGWFLAALPIVTLGVATVGAYRAVLSLREDDHEGIDRTAVRETVRQQFVHATLLGLIPLVLFAIAANYALAYLVTATVPAGLLALCCGYAGLYATLVSMPTLLGLAAGKPVTTALRDGIVWTARHAVGAVALGVVTAALLILTSLLTVAVALLFAGIAFALHVEFISSVNEAETRVATGVTDR